MNFPVRKFLVFFWILTNLFALAVIGIAYLIAWHDGLLNSIRPDDIQSIANSASKGQLAKFCLDQEHAIRGAESALFSILHNWLGVTLLNMTITVCYFYWPKHRSISK